jgi:hypothetical protein
MLMFSPSIKPAALSPSMTAASAPGSAPLRRAAQSTDHFPDSFGRAASGHAIAPLRKAMKSRRRIGDHLVWSRHAVAGRSVMLSVQYGAECAKLHRAGVEGGAYLFCRIYTRHVGPVAQLLMSAPGTLWPSQPGSRKPGRPPAPARLGQNLTQGRHRCIAASAGHSITSSARTSSDGGIVRPRVFAVLRLITSSNFVFCWMGRSAGLAPLRIFPT